MPNAKGYFDFQQPMSKSQPAKHKQVEGNQNGDGHDFNLKGKVTSNAESCYHDMSAGSGSYGNFAEKDASLAYLKERGKKGQEIRSYSGTTQHAKLKRHDHGGTAYDTRPIAEVYEPATSNGKVPSDAVEYNTKKKTRGVQS